jgi:protein-disulfide isomerase
MKKKQQLRYILSGGIILLLITGAVFAVRSYRGKTIPFVHLRTAPEKARGPVDAPIQITDFSDFRCGACKKALPVIAGLEKTYPGKIRVIFKHFPLPNHAWSPLAHQAAECANRAGVFWPYMELLFRDQEKWPTVANPGEIFLGYAQALRLNVNMFAQCLTDPKIKEIVTEESREGEALQIKSTPTFFINAERLVGAVELEMRAHAIIRNILGLPPLPPPPPKTPAPEAETLMTPVAEQTPANQTKAP